MHITNFECKARVDAPEPYEQRLRTFNPRYLGEDRQTDTYFNVQHGRLKLREGKIENALIQYDRDNIAEAKKSSVVLYKHNPDPALKEILIRQLGVRVIVDKTRRIYYIGNVKFHFDKVDTLGCFVEIEAIDDTGRFSPEELKAQCDYYIGELGLVRADFLDKSYADLMMPVIHTIRTDSTHPDFISLVSNLDAHLSAINGDDDAYYAQFNRIDHIRHVVLAYVDGKPAGCGAMKAFAGNAMEIKRMFTDPLFRGRGVAGMVLRELEKWAVEMGMEQTVLETSIHLPQAISLYMKMGYRAIPNFGPYVDMPDSRCYGKIIVPNPPPGSPILPSVAW